MNPTTPPETPLIAYALHENQAADTFPEPAPIPRDWMDGAHQRHPYRCLPLVIANQCGWVLRSPVGFSAYWYGGAAKQDVELRFDRPDNRVVSHFGSGVITFTVPFLFRTPPGINIWVKGPANWIKDGVQPLEGVVETDWLASTFTMNWKMTRVCEWVRFEQGEPFCMLVPVPRGLIESFVPKVVPLATEPELQTQYKKWEQSRSGFLEGLQSRNPEAVARGWQKDYFQGRTVDGKAVESHQTKLSVKPFTSDTTSG
ncbi:DUF6065 family protein [Gemmata sp. JC673]|uniref:DUF6065 family protein n=1 Tax=Gemmata algarum TaxID=2975278 RepID=A0ABU5F1V4_9BACT|nr:DUF6065 family protein [Gemmata algarum]MDY3561550.1 DUF6065 family protein [Gemmata algarum]